MDIMDLNTPSHSDERVRNWDHVETARQLRGLGVEAKHCSIFEQQEVTGDVLLDMDKDFIFMNNFGLIGRRLKTWHTIKAFQEKVKASKLSSVPIPFPSSLKGCLQLVCSFGCVEYMLFIMSLC